MPDARLEAILIAPAAKAPMQRVPAVQAIAGRGLAGDRYSEGKGSFSRRDAPERQATLVEVESLDGLTAELGMVIAPEDLRRNLVTRGVRLPELVRRRFAIGEVVLEGIKLCQPCSGLERVTGQALIKALWNRAGLNAAILRGGRLAEGDPIRIDAGDALVHPASEADDAA